MSETLVNTIDGDKLYAERAVKDASGNSISETYATKSEIPVVDQSYDATSTNAQSGVAVAEALSNVPSSLSAGDGIDITSDVVSAKVDGSTISFNASGELQATVSGGVTDVTVDGTSVVNAQGVAEITMPTFTQVNSDWNASSGVAEILNKPANLVQDANYVHTDENFTSADKTKLSGIATGAEVNVQADWNESDSSSDAYIKNKPDLSIYAQSANLATVATSGDYDDLTNKPTIPAAQVNSDWNASSGVAEILNKPSLATVATTGAYSDLSGTPSLAAVATSGDYDDLTNKPSIPAAQVNSDWNASSGVAEILNKPTLATVATSGDYDDLTNKPTISNVPSVGSSDDGKALVAHYSGGSGTYSWDSLPSGIFPVEYGVTTYAQITDALTAGKLPVLKYVDTANSTNIAVLSYYGSSTAYVFTHVVKAYHAALEPSSFRATQYSVFTNNTWQIRQVDTYNFQADWNNTESSSLGYIKNKPNLATVATSGDYDDLTNKPSIPAAQVNSDWNASSGVAEILNKPTLATVATTGAYSDLSGTPTIPAAQVNSDWNASSGVAEILNKPSLATVATSGSYNDLSDKPTIPVMELFEATYGTTTYADITAAIAAKKIVYCKVSPSGASRMAFLAYIGSNTVEFQYYLSLSSRSATNQLDEVYVYTVNASGWTTTTRKAGVLIAAGTGLTSSYANGTVTINGKDTDQTYDATSANPQSGVAVAGALAGKADAEVVLFDANGSPNQTGPWTLSEARTNFEYLDIYIGTDSSGNEVKAQRFLASSSYMKVDISRYDEDPAYKVSMMTLTFNQLQMSIKASSVARYMIATNGAVSVSTASTQAPWLYKVVGINRIASN